MTANVEYHENHIHVTINGESFTHPIENIGAMVKDIGCPLAFFADEVLEVIKFMGYRIGKYPFANGINNIPINGMVF